MVARSSPLPARKSRLQRGQLRTGVGGPFAERLSYSSAQASQVPDGAVRIWSADRLKVTAFGALFRGLRHAVTNGDRPQTHLDLGFAQPFVGLDDVAASPGQGGKGRGRDF